MIAAVATGGAAGTRRWFMPIAVLLTGTAWLALSLWEQSPYGRYLDHPRWTDVGIAAALCRALPAGDVVLPASLYAGGWLLMIAAMMLPTALPLFRLFDRMVQPRRDYTALMGLLIAGYLAVWAGFGIAAHLLDAAVHAGARQSEWLTSLTVSVPRPSLTSNRIGARSTETTTPTSFASSATGPPSLPV